MSASILELPPPAADQRIAYGDDPNQFGDLRLPTGPGPHPLVIVIHGGYWRARYDLAYFGHCCADLAARGIATWNIEYRRIGNLGGGWPGTFLDVGVAADYVRVLAEHAAVDLTRVASLGHSAGGHLALWLAGRARLTPASPLALANPLPIRAAIALAPVSDLRMAWQLQLSNTAAGELLGGDPDAYPERYAAASPAELLPFGVRQVLIHGTADDAVPYRMAEHYVQKAQAAGDSAELLTLPESDHFAIVDPRTPEWARIVAVLERELDV